MPRAALFLATGWLTLRGTFLRTSSLTWQRLRAHKRSPQEGGTLPFYVMMNASRIWWSLVAAALVIWCIPWCTAQSSSWRNLGERSVVNGSGEVVRVMSDGGGYIGSVVCSYHDTSKCDL